MIALTVYAGARNAMPASRDTLTWAQFCTEVERLCLYESGTTDKLALPAFGPYQLRDGTSRSAANVARMAAAAALDLDGVDLDKLRARLRELGWDAVVHGSPSDGSNGTRKARAYIRLDGEHAPADAGHVRASVAAMLGVTHDPSCNDPSRLFFCGRLDGTPARYYERFVGAPVALASLPPAPAPAPAPAPRETLPPATATPRLTNPAYDAAMWAMLGALGPWHEHEGRKHNICGAMGGVLRKAGWSETACATLLRAWLPQGEAGVDVEAGVRWACAAWRKPAEDVSGTPALAAIIGNEAGAIVWEAAMLPSRVRKGTPAEQPTPAAPAALPYEILVKVDWRHPQPLRYIVPDLELAPGKVSVIQAFAYAGKTPTALALAVCVSAGLPFLGFKTVQCPVLYLDHEGGRLTEERGVRVCKGLGVDPDKIPLEILPPLGLFSDAYIAELKRIVAEDHIGMVVIDTYSSALPADGSSFNESAFRLWADALGRFSNETDVLVVMLVHETKSARGQEGIRGISGHGSLAGAVQAAIALERPDEDKPYEILVRCARATRKGFAPFLIRWSDGENDSLMATKGEAVAKVKRKRGDAANDNRSAKKSDEVRKTGLLMMESTKPSLCYTLKEVNENGGGGANVNKIALQLLRKAGMIEHVRGKYSKTEKGRNATPQEIALALGFDGVAQREK